MRDNDIRNKENTKLKNGGMKMKRISAKKIEEMEYILWGVHIEVDSINYRTGIIEYYNRDYDVLETITIDDLMNYWNIHQGKTIRKG